MRHDEPVLGWRIWRLRLSAAGVAAPVLESCIYRDPWPAQRAFSSECPDHPRPVPACGCGIYAVTTREAALEWARWAQSAVPHPIVVGRVQLWGRILPYSAGYRAELAYPYELEVLAGNGLDGAGARRLASALRERYLVDVVQQAA